MLALGIRYLTGYTVASESSDRKRPEWPPHPRRVFMAMVAAHFQTGSSPEERDTLEWIESLPAPEISAAPTDEIAPRTPVTHFVPINDKAGPSSARIEAFPELTRERQPRVFAKAWLSNDTVFFVWPDATPKPEQTTSLRQLCGKVTRIGHSTSLVQMWVETKMAVVVPNWIPDDIAPTHHWRVAPKGTLKYLQQQYDETDTVDYWNATLKLEELALHQEDKKAKKEAAELKTKLKQRFPKGSPIHRRPDQAVWHGYRAAAKISYPQQQSSTWFDHRLIILTLRSRKSSYRALDIVSTLQITSRLREALIKHADGRLPESLSGHQANGKPSENPHLSFLPLPFCNQEHADGHLMGLALALPKECPTTDRQTLLRLLAEINREGLHLGPLGDWSLEGEKTSTPATTLQPVTWTAFPQGATQWGTITPIVMDQHAKGKSAAARQEKVALSIRESCTRIGLEPPAQVVVTHVSPHLGIPPAQTFPRLKRKDGSERQHTHAILIFDQPVIGPIFVGAGRYRGYGLCRPIN